MFQKLLGQKLDEEIDVEAETSTQGNPEGAGGGSGAGGDTGAGGNENGSGGVSGGAEGGDPGTVENTKESEIVAKFDAGWFNPETMTFDISKVSDDAKPYIQSVIDAIQTNNNNLAIEKAINEQINKAGINVSTETFRKCLDTSNIKVGTDGKVTGVTEAFEALRKSDANLFKVASKESNPLNEGFSPVERKGTLTEDEIINMAYGQE